MIVDFTPWPSLLGGALIGLSASALLASHGRIAGISGIWGGLLHPPADGIGWRAAFLAGLAAGAVAVSAIAPGAVHPPSGRSIGTIAAAGALVGVGTYVGNGCTSGHGVCGLSRRSGRSAVAVATFVAVGIVVATGVGAIGGR